MSWARVIVVAAVLTACKASHSDANEGGATPPFRMAVGSGIETEQRQGDGLEQKDSVPHVAASGLTGSTSPPAMPARPLSSSLTEIGQASPAPEIEDELAIAVFVERVSGGLMPDIEHATGRLRAGMRACYLRSLGDDVPDASRLALRIVVATSGSVKSVRSEGASDIDDSAVDCMIRRAQMATFPAPVGEPAEIVLRIAFLPGHVR